MARNMVPSINYLANKQATGAMELTSRSATQTFPNILWNLNVHTVFTGPHPEPDKSSLYHAIHNFNIMLPPTSDFPMVCFLLASPPKPCMHHSHAPPTSFFPMPSFWLEKSTNDVAPHYSISFSLLLFNPLGYKYYPQHCVLKHPRALCSSLNARDWFLSQEPSIS
jgi:hypothetical protein